MTDKPNNIPDGGPVFPCPHTLKATPTSPPHPGMSLRDWFAGQAAPAMASVVVPGVTQDNAASIVARSAYVIADAMLAERGKEEPQCQSDRS